MFSRFTQGIRLKRKTGRAVTAGALPEKRAWFCFVATLSVALWSINLIPLQQIEYLFSSRVAISQHRLSLLKRMANTQLDDSMRMVDCTAETQVENLSNSEMQAVRVRIILSQRIAADAIAKKLDEMTVPKFESTETVELAKQMRWTRWQHQVASHMIRRLELDQEREREVNSAANAQRPFQLTGYSAPTDNGSVGDAHSPGELQSSLESVRDQSHGNLLALANSLESVRSKSRGFLSLTGAPRVETIARPIQTIHVAVLLLIAVMIWTGLYAATNTNGLAILEPLCQSLSGMTREISTAMARRKEAKQRQKQQLERKPRAIVKSASRNREVDQTVEWLQKNGVTYFGPIQLQPFGADDAASASVIPMVTVPVSMEADGQQREGVVAVERDAVQQDSTDAACECDAMFASYLWLRRLVDLTLLAWIGVFLFRFATDSAWRELFVVAPLAAFSRLICGMP